MNHYGRIVLALSLFFFMFIAFLALKFLIADGGFLNFIFFVGGGICSAIMITGLYIFNED